MMKGYGRSADGAYPGMHDPRIGTDLNGLRELAHEMGVAVLAPHAAAVDREGKWPAASMAALAASGLMGLQVPVRLGGQGQGMLALAVVCEELGRHCSSTAMCFGMHSVATQVLASKATPAQEQRYLAPIARGEHITSLALSEPGTGANFYLPRAHFAPKGEGFALTGEKSFITSGGHADSFVVSVAAAGGESDPGTFSFFQVDGHAPGLAWGPEWDGFGMRGNSSRSLAMHEVPVPRGDMLGEQGDQIWYVFEVVAPFFLIAMAGVYLGIAGAALDLAIGHLKAREHAHTGERLKDLPMLWHDLAAAWTEVEATRQLVFHAARLGDAGAAEAPLALFAAKAKVARMCTAVTDTAMALMGGRGYSKSAAIGRLHRDARAAHVMGPTTHMVETWLGRSLLGLPPL